MRVLSGMQGKAVGKGYWLAIVPTSAVDSSHSKRTCAFKRFKGHGASAFYRNEASLILSSYSWTETLQLFGDGVLELWRI